MSWMCREWGPRPGRVIPRNRGHGLIIGFSTIFQVYTKINIGGDRKVREILNLALNLGLFYGIDPKTRIVGKYPPPR